MIKLVVCVNFRAENFPVAATSPVGGAVDAKNSGLVTSAGVSPSKPASDVMPGSPPSHTAGRKFTATVHPMHFDTAQLV